MVNFDGDIAAQAWAQGHPECCQCWHEQVLSSTLTLYTTTPCPFCGVYMNGCHVVTYQYKSSLFILFSTARCRHNLNVAILAYQCKSVVIATLPTEYQRVAKVRFKELFTMFHTFILPSDKCV